MNGYERQARRDRQTIGAFWVSVGVAVAVLAFFVFIEVVR